MRNEEDLRDRLHRAAENVTVPERSILQATKRAKVRRLRRRSGAVSVAVLLVLVFGGSLFALLPLGSGGPGSNGGPSQPAPATSQPTSSPGPDPGWTTHLDDQGVSVEVPNSWTFDGSPQTNLVSPTPLFAVGTWPFRSGGDCGPTAAKNVPADGAFVWALEEHPSTPKDFPVRSRHFELGALKGPFECFGPKAHLIFFRDAGRFFRFQVVIGADASAQTKSDVLRVLDSFAVGRQPGSITYRDEARGLTVTYPTSWFRATQQLTPHLSDPHEILALGTYPLRPGGPNCAQFPVNALRDLGPGDALIWLAERTGPGDAPARPDSFLSAISAQGTDESPACLSSKKDFSHRVIAFSDSGRVFELYVAYGHSIPTPRFAELLAILDGLRFDPKV